MNSWLKRLKVMGGFSRRHRRLIANRRIRSSAGGLLYAVIAEDGGVKNALREKIEQILAFEETPSGAMPKETGSNQPDSFNARDHKEKEKVAVYGLNVRGPDRWTRREERRPICLRIDPTLFQRLYKLSEIHWIG